MNRSDPFAIFELIRMGFSEDIKALVLSRDRKNPIIAERGISVYNEDSRVRGGSACGELGRYN